jgi:type IV pilus assembly protein PilA
MTTRLRRLLTRGVAVSALMFAGCQKKPEAGAPPAAGTGAAPVATVKAAERSAHFAAVNRQLELGGTLYGYVDIDGDVAKFTQQLQGMAAQMAGAQPNLALLARQDFAAIATTLGLTDVKALGASSVADGTGFYRNRLFIYTGGERHGLFAGLGGKPAPLKHIGLVPADASFYAETEMDLGAVYKTINAVVTKVAGEPAGREIENALKKAGETAAISLIDLIYGLKGRSAFVLRLDETRTMRWPGRQALVLPAMSFFVCIEGIGQVVEPSLAKVPLLRRSEAGVRHIYEFAQPLPIEGVQPAVVIDGGTLFVTSSLAFLDACRDQKSGLAQTPEFQRALAEVGTEGNGFTYVSPRFFEQVRRVESLNPNLPAESKPTLSFVMANLPKVDRPLVANRINLDDGILVRAHLNRSMKQDLAAVSFYNPVTLGLMAAMAIPSFQKVRAASQEKAVLNNLRMLAAATDQYCLETGARSATYDQLVGPDKYVRMLNPVAGEDYRALRFVPGEPLRVQLPNGKTVEYAP